MLAGYIAQYMITHCAMQVMGVHRVSTAAGDNTHGSQPMFLAVSRAFGDYTLKVRGWAVLAAAPKRLGGVGLAAGTDVLR